MVSVDRREPRTLLVAGERGCALRAQPREVRTHRVADAHRVAALAASIAEQLGLEEEVVEAVRIAGRLHDVGKIGIRESVLNKPGTLTDEEYEHVKSHVEIGMEILAWSPNISRSSSGSAWS